MEKLEDFIDKTSINRKAAIEALESFFSSKINPHLVSDDQKKTDIKPSSSSKVIFSELSGDEGVDNLAALENYNFDPFDNIGDPTENIVPSASDTDGFYQQTHEYVNENTSLLEKKIVDLKRKALFLSKMDTFTSALIPAAITLLFTNSAQPLLIFLLRQFGGAPAGAYFFLFPTYLGMICVGLYSTKKTIWKENWIYPGILAGIDFLHQIIEKAGLLYCGPCLYTVASSSNTLFLALFTSMYLKVKITKNTAISLTIISLAVSLSNSGELSEITSTHIIGFALVIIASILNALNSVIGEIILKENKIEGPNLVCIMGFISFIPLTLWTCIWTIPNWSLISQGLEINIFAILMILAALFVSNFIRSSVYWILIKRAGSLFTGVLKALRIVIVIFVSHLLFSHIDPLQRINMNKIITALMCSTGTVLYSIDNNNKIDNFKEETEEADGATRDKDGDEDKLMVNNEV